jgi:hypothetical protein
MDRKSEEYRRLVDWRRMREQMLAAKMKSVATRRF